MQAKGSQTPLQFGAAQATSILTKSGYPVALMGFVKARLVYIPGMVRTTWLCSLRISLPSENLYITDSVRWKGYKAKPIYRVKPAGLFMDIT